MVCKILVTGGAGYLGSTLCKILLEKGYAVTVLDNFYYGQNSLLDCCSYETFDVVRGDCRDEALLGKLLKNQDVVIPLAAMVGAPLCDRDKTAAVTIPLNKSWTPDRAETGWLAGVGTAETSGRMTARGSGN